jgi:prepilin-type N-terminal cleavage/methylation domain-containing protein
MLNRRSCTVHYGGMTLIEVLLVVVLVAVLAAIIIPKFVESTDEAKASVAETNLNELRKQIELFKVQHGGTPPAAGLVELTTATTYRGQTFGPYVTTLPENPLSGQTAVKAAAGAAIVVGDVTAVPGGGWIYSAASGEIRIDHADYWQK